ncbi:MAG: UDP-N-acetylmuramate--L-alanine ligase, partial [Flavobacteriaceae bacterium]|nr:UDP-N-acetylmuramate--L-alanine ligase [Flavobacteriaceae bacterium]
MSLKDKKYYFLGIGGIGMSALAKYLFLEGYQVMGYDKTPTPLTTKLAELGLPIIFDASIDAVPEPFRSPETEVIFTPAIPKDHPQLLFFQDQGNAIQKRAALLGEITKSTTVFAIAGTHGKTTTASFLTHFFDHLNMNFTAFLGGIMNGYESNLISKGNQYSIVEADEYDRSFLKLFPDFACITTTDPDHLDVYGTPENIKETFAQFSSLVSQGVVAKRHVGLGTSSYSIEEQADYYAQQLRPEAQGYFFNFVTPKQEFKDIYISSIGKHNLSNAIAALALMDVAGLSVEKALPALANFKGIQRRMQLFSMGDKLIIDDYAHHPEEIKAVLDTVKEFYPSKKNTVIFQPHLFSRTQDFMTDFANI